MTVDTTVSGARKRLQPGKSPRRSRARKVQLMKAQRISLEGLFGSTPIKHSLFELVGNRDVRRRGDGVSGRVGPIELRAAPIAAIGCPTHASFLGLDDRLAGLGQGDTDRCNCSVLN